MQRINKKENNNGNKEMKNGNKEKPTKRSNKKILKSLFLKRKLKFVLYLSIIVKN